MHNSFKEDTNLAHLGSQTMREVGDGEVLPIYNTTAYVIADLDDYDQAVSGNRYYYSRSGNPNKDALAETLSFMENGEQSLIFSSGMGAIATTLLSLLKSKDHILVNNAIYGETIELLNQLYDSYGVEVSYVDFTDIEEVRKALRSNTRIIYTEVISNPLINVINIPEISKIAKSVGALTIVDSTFTTPYTMKPLDCGADIVIHSLTKFINGHSDVSGGSVTSTGEIIKRISPMYLLLGATLDPNSAWLTLRSIRTFNMRMEKQANNAKALAEFLNKDARIKKVNYPSLITHPQHELAKRVLKNGYGNMISFRVEDHREKVNAFIHELKLVKYLGTLGGYRTSLAHPATAFRSEFTKEELESMGMYEGLIRISVGIEDGEDLLKDFERALKVFD